MYKKTFLPLLILSGSLLQSARAFAQATCYRNGVAVPCEELKGILGGTIGFFAFAVLFGIVSTIFWLVMLIHAATKPIENKALWIIVMVFTGIVGAVVYYFMVKRKFNAVQMPMPPMPSI